MGDLTSVDEILDFAIQNEQSAVDLYTDLAKKIDRPEASAIFLEYADEERAHKAKLEKVKSGKTFLNSNEPVLDLNITYYSVEQQEIGDKPDHQAVLLYAMNLEKAAFKLYSDLAAKTDNEDVKDLFLGLAKEEAKHKLRFEVEYDQEILTHN
ncbi:ferritin family protein [Acidobacteriota bacterium]